MALNQWVVEGTGLGGLGFGGGKLTLDMRDHRQHRAGHTLAADVEHRPYLLHAVDGRQSVGERAECRERRTIEQVPRAGRGTDDAIPVWSAEVGSHLVDQPEVGVGVTEQRPQIVVNPETGQADGC